MIDLNITSSVAEIEPQTRLKCPHSVASFSGTVDHRGVRMVMFETTKELFLRGCITA